MNRKVYLITDHTGLDEKLFYERIELACKYGIDLLQVREKNISGRNYYEIAKNIKYIADKYSVPLIIDDRIDIAMAIDAAGIHLGQEDIPVWCARELLGPDKIIGATTKTIEQAEEAMRQGANYLGVGAIFKTTTHVKTVHTSIETLEKIKNRVNIPVFAIGGINPQNIKKLHNTKIEGVAVVSSIMRADKPQEVIKFLKE